MIADGMMAAMIGARSEMGALCAWCGSAAQPRAARLARCPRCGAATTWPPPDIEELEQAYSGWYRPPGGRFPGAVDRLLHHSRASLARRLDQIAPAGPVLDVGAGEGTLVRALRARGREALGLERESGAEGVIAADILEFQERRGEWAAVTFWHSLEHIAAAGRAVDQAVDLLAPRGVLVVAVPNLDSWQSRAFGSDWFHLDVPRHLVHLPGRTLIEGIRARGLQVERVSWWRGGQEVFGWLYGLVRALPGRPNLYSAIRRPEARSDPMTAPQRLGSLLAASALSPLAVALAAAEAVSGDGGSVYLEARRS